MRWRSASSELTILPVALPSLRATTLRSLALAATGAVALFGSVALGGARRDLLRGIDGFAHSYAADASIWVGKSGRQPGDRRLPARTALRGASPGSQASRACAPSREASWTLGERRVWIIARPPGAERDVLASQIAGGSAASAVARLGEGGWIAVSKQIAEERHVGVGGTLTLPTPSGEAPFRVAATTTNLAWSPGRDLHERRRLQPPVGRPARPPRSASSSRAARASRACASEIERALGPASGLEVVTASEREASIDALTSEGLGQLGEISTLLLVAAILAMAAALTSAIWQRRVALAALRLSGVRPVACG